MKSVDKFFICIYLTLMVNFFDIVNIKGTVLNSVASYSQKKILLILTIVYIFFRFVFMRDNRRTQFTNFRFFIWISVGLTILVTAFSAMIYNQGFFSTFLISNYYFVLIGYFIFNKILITQESWVWFYKLVLKFAGILSITKLIQSWAIVRGYSIFYLNTTLDETTARSLNYLVFGFTRIPSASDFVFFSVLLASVLSISGIKMNFTSGDLISIITSFMYLFLVSQTRSYELVLLVVFFMVLVIKGHRIYGMKSDTLFVIIGLPIMILALAELFNRIVINASLSRSYSISVRMDAVFYYLSHLRDNGWFSIGFARDDIYPALVHGSNNWGTLLGYNLDDVGVIGLVAQFGLAAIPLLMTLFFTFIRDFVKAYRKSAGFLLMVVIIGSMVTTSYFNPQRIGFLPIIFVLMDFVSMDKGGLF